MEHTGLSVALLTWHLDHVYNVPLCTCAESFPQPNMSGVSTYIYVNVCNHEPWFIGLWPNVQLFAERKWTHSHEQRNTCAKSQRSCWMCFRSVGLKWRQSLKRQGKPLDTCQGLMWRVNSVFRLVAGPSYLHLLGVIAAEGILFPLASRCLTPKPSVNFNWPKLSKGSGIWAALVNFMRNDLAREWI